MYDALIIGAGPTGSTVAESLAGQGFKVLVIEEHPYVGRPVCCSGIIGRECWEQLSLPPTLVLREARSATFYSPAGSPLRLAKEAPQAYILDRSGLDQALAQRAQAAGAEYLLGTKATAVAVDGRVRLEVEHRGQARYLQGRALVLATGFGSPLPQQLGLGQIKHSVLAAQAEVEMQGVDEVEVYCGHAIAPGFFAWLVPTTPGRGLAGLMAANPTPYLRAFFHRLKEEGKVSAAGPVRYGRIPLEPLPRSYRGRVVAVGEVAGQVKPTTGGGIYYGIIASKLAGQNLGQALAQDDFSILSQYQKQWKSKLSQEMKRGSWWRWLFAQLSDSQIEDIFHFLRRDGLAESFLQDRAFSFDWHAQAMWRFLSHGGAKAALSGLGGIPLHILGLRRSRRSPAP